MDTPLNLFTPAAPSILTEAQWQDQQRSHIKRIHPWITGFRQRRKRGLSHPIYDFLFVYYTAPASRLEKWCPGFNICLQGDSAASFLADSRYRRSAQGIQLDPQRLKTSELHRFKWIQRLLQSAEQRPPRFNCFGLHEWAMVYRTQTVRHPQVPLRLSQDAINDVVEQHSIACSHYDAFRFFTTNAAPRNTLHPNRNNRAAMEQCGCLHFNMDLYKWAYKLHPWSGSAFILDTFFLALQARTIDMQASPYDLSAYNLEPIKIETPEGRQIYQTKQKAIAKKAAPLRKHLIELCQAVNPSSAV